MEHFPQTNISVPNTARHGTGVRELQK